MKIKNTVTNLILSAYFKNFYLRHLLSLVPLVFLLIHLITAVTLEKTEEVPHFAGPSHTTPINVNLKIVKIHVKFRFMIHKNIRF